MHSHLFYVNGKLDTTKRIVALDDTTDADTHYIKKSDYKYLVIHARFPNGGVCDYIINYKVFSFLDSYTAVLCNGYFSNSAFYAAMTIRLTYNGNSENFYVQKVAQSIGGGINGNPLYYIYAIY